MQNIIEVGSWMGLSTRHIANILPKDGKVFAVDRFEIISDGNSIVETWYSYAIRKIYADGILSLFSQEDSLYDQFLSNVIHSKLTHKIVPIKMESSAAAKSKVITTKADGVYIDATH